MPKLASHWTPFPLVQKAWPRGCSPICTRLIRKLPCNSILGAGGKELGFSGHKAKRMVGSQMWSTIFSSTERKATCGRWRQGQHLWRSKPRDGERQRETALTALDSYCCQKSVQFAGRTSQYICLCLCFYFAFLKLIWIATNTEAYLAPLLCCHSPKYYSTLI